MLNALNLDVISRLDVSIEERASQRIDQHGFNLVPYTAPAIGDIGRAQPAQLRAGRVLDCDRNAPTGGYVRQSGIHDSRKDLIRDLRPDEVKHDDVVADPVQDFGTVQNSLEVTLDLCVNLGRDIQERVV